jgi:hypothetical protein
MSKGQRRFSYPLNFPLIRSLPPEQQVQHLLRAWQNLTMTIWRQVPEAKCIVWSCALDRWDCSMIAEVVA